MTSMNQSVDNQQFSNVQPIWKFCFLYIITFGIYEIPWAHKHWKFIKERENLKISAWGRSWFLPLFLYSLCQKVFALAEEQGYREKPSPFQITLFYWVFVALSKGTVSSSPSDGSFSISLDFLSLKISTEPVVLIGLLSFVPLLSILKAINYYWEQKQRHLPKRTSFTGREIAWVVLGAILWLSLVLPV